MNSQLLRNAARAAALAALFLSTPALAGAGTSLSVSAVVMCQASTATSAPRPDWAQARGGAVLTCPEGATASTTRHSEESARQQGAGLVPAASERPQPSTTSERETAEGDVSFVTVSY